MKILEKKPVRQNIVVELTPKDQDVLFFALRHVGGDPEGPRGQANQISDLLRDIGARLLSHDKHMRNYFTDTWEYEDE